MKTSARFLNRATLVALLLFAGSTGVTSAMAEERAASDPGTIPAARIQEASREQARAANEAAAREAAVAVKANSRLNLDIQLIGRTSVLIAGEM
jgi:hypothetical protein